MLRKLLEHFLRSIFFPLPLEAHTEKILLLLEDIKNLITVLTYIHSIEPILRKLHMALAPEVQAALDSAKQKITDAITKEVQDVKDLVNSGADNSEIVAALDAFGDNIAASIDTISTGGEPPTNPSPGNETTTPDM